MAPKRPGQYDNYEGYGEQFRRLFNRYNIEVGMIFRFASVD